MKKKNYIIVSIIVFSFFNLVNFFYINNNLSKIESNTDINYNNMDNLETSGYWDFISIHIDDNNGKGNGSWAWASAQPWCKGSGTFKYPYIIENLTIDAKGISSGIIIENSKVYFIIENCTVINSGSGIQDAGIKLINCSNGIIQNNNLSNNGNILGGHGILLNGTLASCKNNTISNNKIYDNGWAGIYLETDCNNNIIYNNSVGNNIGDPIPPFPPLPLSYWQFTRQYIGIYLRNQCNGNNISKNLLDNNNWYGLYFETECNNNILQGNEAFESEYGIYIHNNCDYNKIIENVANHNDYYGIYIYRYCDHNNITKNIANSNYDYGLYLFFLCKYNNITNNILINNNYYGIYLERACDHNIILNNTSKSQGYFYQYKGIFLQGCGHNLIKNNNLSYNLCGIELWSSCFNNIIENEIYHNYWGGNGIVLQVFSSYNNIINNSIYGEGNGIFLSQSYNCRIFNNNLFDITELGIEIRNTNGTILSGNKMKGNGIFLDGDFDQLTKFTIYTNNTVNGKPIYYYVNKTGLGKENFTNAGQIILINCNNSLISDLNVSNSSIGISSYYSVNLRILNNTIFFSKKCGIYLYKTNYSTIINNNFKGINPDIIEVDCEGNIFDQPSINPIIYDEDDDQKEEKKLDRNAFTLNFLLILGSISIITLLLFYYYLMINKLHRNHYFNKNKKLKTGLGIFPTTRAIMEEIIEESSFFQLLEGEISASNTESLKKINLERVSEELLENIALIKMSKSNKKEFIIELLALSDDERLMIINSILNRNNSNNILD